MKMNTMVQPTLLLASHVGSRDTEAYALQLTDAPQQAIPPYLGSRACAKWSSTKLQKQAALGCPLQRQCENPSLHFFQNCQRNIYLNWLGRLHPSPHSINSQPLPPPRG